MVIDITYAGVLVKIGWVIATWDDNLGLILWWS